MNKSEFNTPVLFLIFNRPDTTQKVFDVIKKIRPAYLYVSADGPRPGKNEEDKCKAARDIINQIDWDCKLVTNFSGVNLGCKNAVSSGVNWFFENVEEGIILEDDCLPDPTFFNFCEQLLIKYRDDNRVMHIGGTNFQDGAQRGIASYYFSRFVHVWGWATWRRAWKKYDVNIKSFKSFSDQNLIKEIFPDKTQQDFWTRTFELVYSGRKDTWDYQWNYTLLVNNGLSIIPNHNLVTNLGFGLEATHTIHKGSPLSSRVLSKIVKVIHPEHKIPFRTADDYTFRRYLSPGKLSKLWLLINSKF